MDLHFISGLPRSGSTVLSALLKQNPAFHAGMSSPLAGIYTAMLSATSAKNEFALFVDADCRRRLLRAVFDAYYGHTPERAVFFDTNRQWTAKLPSLVDLFPDSKCICCVRDMTDIVGSIERLVSSNPHEPSGMFRFDARGNVYDRCDTLLRPDGLIGSALNALKGAFYSPHATRLLLVRYESFLEDPLEVLKRIYDFIGQPHFPHDISHVEFEADEFDRRIGTANLHRVRGPVVRQHPKTLLPPDLHNKLRQHNFWAGGANPMNVTVL